MQGVYFLPINIVTQKQSVHKYAISNQYAFSNSNQTKLIDSTCMNP